MRRRGAAAGTLAALLLAVGPEAAAAGFVPVEVTVRQLDGFLGTSAEERFGPLVFRGGLELGSADRRFGSFSGLDFAPDGTLYAVSDTGRWFAATPVIEDGRLTGLADARIAPILNHAGEALAGKRWGDAEALRIVERDGDITAYVAFEQVNDVRAFDGGDFAVVNSRPVPLPSSVQSVSRNGGLEALAVARIDGPLAGAMVLIAEHSLDGRGNHRAWIVGGPRAGTFSLARSADYDVTDAAFLPGGDLLVLERKFRFPFGLGMRIRRIAEADLAPGATVDGEVLIDADLRYQIDNMEGIAVRADEAGAVTIALISDDNGSPLQRTLLLYFALADEPAID